MKVLPYLDAPISQAEFAEMIGVSEARISQLVSDSVLTRGETAHAWLIAYCERLRDQAAGRSGLGGADLVLERALLTRSQREAQDMKNAVARGQFAPVGILADVLGAASSAVVDRMDQVEPQLRKSCPQLPLEAMTTVKRVMGDARNEWIRVTSKLVSDQIDAMALAGDDEEAEPDIEDDA